MDATTTRASTVIRSIPTRETRTQASMTIPLSRTRSRTSMRLDPPELRSTGIGQSPLSALAASDLRAPALLGDLALERGEPFSEGFVLLQKRLLVGSQQMVIMLPPIETDLFRLVNRADDEADPDRKELDLGERHLDVARHDESLVEHAIENIDQARASLATPLEVLSHKPDNQGPTFSSELLEA